MKPTEVAHIEFIKVLLRNGKKRGEILQIFGEKWQDVSSRTFDRRLKDAETELATELRKVSDKANEQYATSINAVKSSIIGATERMEILSKIATGQITYKKPVVVDGMLTDADCEPDFADRKNAIAELNKMDGSYTPIQVKQEITVDTIKEIVINPVGEQPKS